MPLFRRSQTPLEGIKIPFFFIVSSVLTSSLDPVALDQATVDLVHKSSISPHSVLSEVHEIPTQGPYEWFSHTPRFDPKSGEMDFSGKKSKHWELQLKLAEEIGLGTRDYNLIEVKIEKDK